MSHIESDIKIYKTKDYNIFKMLPGNRLLSEKKIKLLIKDISAGNNLLKFFPILVDKQMNVLDGQHRLYAARKTQSDVYYIISSQQIDISVVASMNSRSSSWNAKDYLNCYIRRNNVNYQQVQSLMDKTFVKVSTAIQLLSGTDIQENGRSSIAKRFMEGTFIAYDYEKVLAFMDQICDNFHWFSRSTSRQFLSLAIRLYETQGKEGLQKLSNKIKNDEVLKDQLLTSNIKYYLQKAIDEIIIT